MRHHFLTSYENHVEEAISRLDRRAAMESAIGGNFNAIGKLQRYLLFQYGLTPQSFLVDVGCGSGRLAIVLRDLPDLCYLGIDVVDDLLRYAAEIAQRRDWTFKKSTNLEIPAVDNSQDIVCAFSVFTHLLHEETYLYLKEIKRVLKPRGRCVFSFLDFSVPAHWTVFQTNLENINQRSVLNQFMDSGAIRAWCQHLGFEILAIHPGSEPHIQLPEPVQFEDGSVLTGKGSMGQSVCVIQK